MSTMTKRSEKMSCRVEHNLRKKVDKAANATKRSLRQSSCATRLNAKSRAASTMAKVRMRTAKGGQTGIDCTEHEASQPCYG